MSDTALVDGISTAAVRCTIVLLQVLFFGQFALFSFFGAVEVDTHSRLRFWKARHWPSYDSLCVRPSYAHCTPYIRSSPKTKLNAHGVGVAIQPSNTHFPQYQQVNNAILPFSDSQ